MEGSSFPYHVLGEELGLWRDRARQQAIVADVPVAEIDWLLLELTGLDRLALKLATFRIQPHIPMRVSLPELDARWQQRIQQRVPVQYLTGTTPWRGFSLAVTPAVLIPRPETELLVDRALIAVTNRPGIQESLESGHWVDLGTGSGAIALALATSFPNAIIHAVDRSEAALEVARQNAIRLGLGDRIHFYQGNWFEPLEFLTGQFSGMVANPPYIPTSLIPTLQPEVAHHEPHLALDGGEDGLDAIRHLVTFAPRYLRSGGIWLIEMMAGQGEAVRELQQQQGNYDDIQIFSDLAGLDRIALAYRR